MSFETIKIAGNDNLIDKKKFASNSLISKMDVPKDAQNIFDLYNKSDNGLLDKNKTLNITEQSSIINDIVKYAGKDNILSNKEIRALLKHKGLENPSDADINGAKDLFVNIYEHNGSGSEVKGSEWNTTTKDLSIIEKNMTFNLNGKNSSITISTKDGKSFNIQETSLLGDDVKFLNRKPQKSGKDGNIKLKNGDEISVGNQVWIYNNKKLENTGLDKETYKMLFPKGINGKNLKQGQVGDCYLVATLSQIADNPTTKLAMARLISAPDGKDGDIYVRFPNQEGNPIKISKKEIKEIKDINNPGILDKIAAFLWGGDEKHLSGSLGFQILEKAYGQSDLIKDNKYKADSVVKLNPKKSINEITNGGHMSDVMRNILGIDGQIIFSGDSKKTLKEKKNETIEFLNDAAADPNNYIITASSLFKKNKSDKDMYKAGTSDNKIAFGHAYNISKIDAKNKNVYIRNPWNTSKEICLSYDNFIKSFSDIEYAKLN